MSFLNNLAEAMKDMKFDGQLNNEAIKKQAECERDASNFRERQETIRLIICYCAWVAVILIAFIGFLIFRS